MKRRLVKEKLERKIVEEVKIEKSKQEKRLEFQRKIAEEERDKKIKGKLLKLEIQQISFRPMFRLDPFPLEVD